MESVDYAFKMFQALIEEVNSYRATIITEQDTRVKIINRILTEILNYSLADIQTESYSGSRYLDYQAKVNGIFRLIVEAKRESVDFEMDKSKSGRSYQLNGPVFSGRELQDGIDQTIYYAALESIELGCLTNGETWIVFRANRGPGSIKPKEGRAVVFSDLDGIANNFRLFYDLLSSENIAENKYKAIFQEFEGHEIRTKDFVQSLITPHNLRPFIGPNTYYSDFERVMNTFFSKLAGDEDPEFLAKCFVETKESQAAEFQISRIAEDFIDKVKSIDTVEGEAIREVIERIKQTNRQEFVILVGGKGAGKSTFVDRFFNYVLSSTLKDDCIVVRINLAGYKGSELDVIKWLDENLLEECETTLYNGAPTAEEIQGIFYSDYQRLRVGNWKELYNKDKTQFKIDFGKFIEGRRENRPTEYIQKLIGNIVKSRKKIPCIVFDNTDHFSIDIQEKVFQYARSIYVNELCLVIVPITDKTSWTLSSQGAIRSYENEVFYLPTPSPKKIIEKRIAYLDEKIEYEKTKKGRYFFTKGIKLEISDIEGFVRYLQLVFLQDRLVLKWIGSLSNYDIRTCLEITRDLIKSPHLSMVEYLKAFIEHKGIVTEDQYLMKPYRIKNALIKKNYESYPISLHTYVQCLFYATGDVNTTPLLAIRILQLLTDKKLHRSSKDGFLPVNQIIEYFGTTGIEGSIVHKTLQFLLTSGLISSFDPSVVEIDKSRSVELTPSGSEHYYWSVNDLDYFYIMLEVTPIADRILYKEFEEQYYRPHTKLALTKKFINYLEAEDAQYCRLPNHLSYEGQKFVLKRFDWHKKLIDRNLEGNYRKSRASIGQSGKSM